MNSDRQAAEPGLNGQSDLLARHDSLKCSNSDTSTSSSNETPSAAVALEPENDASQGTETSSKSKRRGLVCCILHIQL